MDNARKIPEKQDIIPPYRAAVIRRNLKITRTDRMRQFHGTARWFKVRGHDELLSCLPGI